MIEAHCTWGEGDDILLSYKDHRMMLFEEPVDKDRAKHGYSLNGSTFLTLDEAKSLRCSLNWAIQAVEDLEAMAAQHDDTMEAMEAKLDGPVQVDCDGLIGYVYAPYIPFTGNPPEEWIKESL